MMFDNDLLDDHQLALLIEERMHGPMLLFWQKNPGSRAMHAKKAGGGHLRFHNLVDLACLVKTGEESGAPA